MFDAVAAEALPADVEQIASHQEAASQAELAHLLTEAQALEARGERVQAANLYRSILTRWPDSQVAQLGLVRVDRVPDIVLDASDQRRLAAQQARIELRVNLDRAELLAAEGDFAEASVALDQARSWLAMTDLERDRVRVAEVEALIARMRGAQQADRQEAFDHLARQQRTAVAVAKKRRVYEEGVLAVEMESIIHLRQLGHYQRP